MRLIKTDENKEFDLNVKLASSFFSRLRGLLAKPALADNEGLFIKPCSSIHTFGMRYKIDIVFFNDDMEIVAIHRNVSPFGIRMKRGARSVLELKGGMAERLGLLANQQYELRAI